MGFVSHDTDPQTALLVCDECDHYFCDGARSPKSRRDSTPGDLTPFFKNREEIPPSAVRSGWRATIGKEELRARWTCPACVREPG